MILYIIIIDNNNVIEIGNEGDESLSLDKAELIIHPVRLQILQSLSLGELTTQQISEVMPNVATSSIYRHLKLLLKGGIVEVAETRPVKGIQEKVYRLALAPRLSQADLANFTKEDHLKYFTSYIATLLQGFADYLESKNEKHPNLEADYVGYTELMFFANEDELKTLGEEMNRAIRKVAQNPPENGRQQRKIAFIAHPVNLDKEEK